MKKNPYFTLSSETTKYIQKLEGPIAILGAGGFIGVNMLKSLLLYRKDIYGFLRNSKKNWRINASFIPKANLIECNLTKEKDISMVIKKIMPKTIFNVTAYGAYSKQKDYKKIYTTNFNSIIYLIENLKKFNFSAYLHAGSSSEYGELSTAPLESSELSPNSHYAVSKVASYYALKYYGKIEKLPVVHLRLYSVYGPFEETDRFIPQLVLNARHNSYPPFVNPNISRDFIHVKDVTAAFIAIATKIKRNMYGEAFNIGTGKITTILDLAMKVKKMCNIKDTPKFGKMKKRIWDHENKWYANMDKAKKIFKWEPRIDIDRGLQETINWQKDLKYDKFYQNWH